MNNIVLNKLYLENYKLFIKETLTFEEGLNIFDGPNGYGKTSVFDAIEFMITGTIKRITDNKAINGSLKYNHIFLANDSRKDTIIKSEFHVKDGSNDSPIIKGLEDKINDLSANLSAGVNLSTLSRKYSQKLKFHFTFTVRVFFSHIREAKAYLHAKVYPEQKEKLIPFDSLHLDMSMIYYTP